MNIYSIFIDNYNNNTSYNNDEDKKLIQACKENNIERVKYLAEQCADVNSIYLSFKFIIQFKIPLIMVACQLENLEMVKCLVEHGANVNINDNLYNTPLYLTCSYNNIFDVAKYLIDHGADVNCVNGGNTALISACDNTYGNDNLDVIKYLVEHGANVNYRNCNNETPLYFACKHNNIERVKFLVEHGANIDFYVKNGEYLPLISVCLLNFVDIVKYLVEHGADVNIKVYKYVCRRSNYEIFKYILGIMAEQNYNELKKVINNTERYLKRNLSISETDKQTILNNDIPITIRNNEIFNS